MNLELLGRLLGGTNLVPGGAGPVLAAVPELVDGLPPLREVAGKLQIDSSCGPALTTRVERALTTAVHEAAAGRAVQLDRRDELVAALVTLVADGLSLSPAGGMVPVLQLLGDTVRTLARPGPELASGLERIRSMAVEPQGAAWARVAGAIQGRLGLCAAEVAAAGLRVPDLARAVMGSRLALLFPPGKIDAAAQLPVLLAITGSPIGFASAQGVVVALRLVVGGVLERRALRKETADDEVLLLGPLRPEIADLGVERAVCRILGDPAALAQLLPSLPRHLDQKALVRAQVPAEVAHNLLTMGGAIALASALAELALELRRWEVLAALGAATGPVDEGRRVERALLVPHRPARLAVVAVGLGLARTQAARRAPSMVSVERTWRDLERTVPGTVRVDLGVVALAVFWEPAEALAFALRVGPAFGEVRPPASVSWGTVLGGTDGQTTRLHGPAVDTALANLPAGGGGPFEVRRVHAASGRLVGDGVVVDAATVEELGGSWSGVILDVPAGLQEAGVDRAFGVGGVEVLAMARVADGVWEGLLMPEAEWHAWAARSAPAATLVPPAPAASAGSRSPPPPPDPTELQASSTRRSAVSEADPFADLLFELESDPDSEHPDPPLGGDPFAGGPSHPPATPEPPPAAGLAEDPFRAVATPANGSMPYGSALLAVFDEAGAAPEEAEAGLGEPPDASEEGFAEADRDPQDFSNYGLPGTVSTIDGATDPEPGRGARVAGPLVPSVAEASVEDADTDETERSAVASAAPTPVPGASARSFHPEPVAEARMDFSFVLGGYLVYPGPSDMVFGRPYGRRLVDCHRYPLTDMDEAYGAFLSDKIREGFVPRTDLVSDTPTGVTGVALDMERVGRAWRGLA